METENKITIYVTNNNRFVVETKIKTFAFTLDELAENIKEIAHGMQYVIRDAEAGASASS